MWWSGLPNSEISPKDGIIANSSASKNASDSAIYFLKNLKITMDKALFKTGEIKKATYSIDLETESTNKLRNQIIGIKKKS
ncbi:MAG: hypothetical protein ACRC42_02970 [Mycoplasma sp.]